MATFELKETTIKPATDERPRVIEYAYVRRVDELVSEPHRGVFAEDELDSDVAIAADGTTKTGSEILADAGVSL